MIDLSSRPKRINADMDDGIFRGDNVVYGSIKSAEAYGYVVDLGHSRTTGFIKYSDDETQKMRLERED